MMDNKLFLISGVSGSGKSTLMKSVMSNELISFTTRAKRTNEVHGEDYMFISKDEFEHLLNNNGLMEYTKYGDNYYGLSRSEYENKIYKNNAFAIVDVNGLKQMKKIHKNCVSIFVFCTREEAEQRMKKRGESESFIQKRISTFNAENENIHLYNHIIFNHDGDLDESLEYVKDIVGGLT